MIAEKPFTPDDFRTHIQAMSDEKLIQIGNSCASLADPAQAPDKRRVRRIYILRLRECREKWKRRHSKTT
jgi:hypothetical protein